MSILKSKLNKIDATRRKINYVLGAFYNEIRKPVVEYKAEKDQIKAEENSKIKVQPRTERGTDAAIRLYNGVPYRIRTCDLRLRRPLLYPAELRRH